MKQEELNIKIESILNNVKVSQYIEKDYNNIIEKLNKLDLGNKDYQVLKKRVMETYIDSVLDTLNKVIK